jgi:hypothetical protein
MRVRVAEYLQNSLGDAFETVRKCTEKGTEKRFETFRRCYEVKYTSRSNMGEGKKHISG